MPNPFSVISTNRIARFLEARGLGWAEQRCQFDDSCINGAAGFVRLDHKRHNRGDSSEQERVCLQMSCMEARYFLCWEKMFSSMLSNE